MIQRLLKAAIDKNLATDSSQASDIAGLKTNVGTVPSGSGNDLQSQITALGAKIGTVPSGEGNDLQSQITALASRVKTLEDEDTTGDS